MKTLSASQLARMRTQASALLYSTGVLQAATLTPDGAGGVSESWAAVTGGTVACRLDPLGLTSRQNVAALRESAVAAYRLSTPHDSPLAEGQQVVVGGNTYQVLQFDVDHDQRVLRRAIVAEVR